MDKHWQLTPYLTVSDAAGAIKFYQEALDAKIARTMPTDDGKKLMHAELSIHGAKLYLSDDFPEWNEGRRRDPKSLGGSSVTLHLEVPDAVEVADCAVRHGATITMPVERQFWGDIYGKFVDPYGFEWSVSTPSPVVDTPVAI